MSGTDAGRRMAAARTGLVMDDPFFGALALRLALREDPGCGTAWVDGVTLGFDPAFVEGLTLDECKALVAHEVMHCACGHPWRRDAREQRRWNMACDLAVNPILQDAGYTLPEGALIDPQHSGKSSEWIYDRLPPSQDGDGQGSGSGAGQQPGEVRDAHDDANQEEATEADWQQAVQQAAVQAKMWGNLPGAAERFAKEAARSRTDWRSVLRRFVQETARADYSWSRPNPRHLVRGFYLPALISEEMGPLVVVIDTSGSIDEVLVGQFASELQAIADECSPSRVHVLSCDSQVQGHDVFERGEAIEVKPKGGGGTDFRPAFEAVEELDDPPACLVYLTDLEGRFPDREPAYPVLWAATSASVAPFGETIRIE